MIGDLLPFFSSQAENEPSASIRQLAIGMLFTLPSYMGINWLNVPFNFAASITLHKVIKSLIR